MDLITSNIVQKLNPEDFRFSRFLLESVKLKEIFSMVFEVKALKLAKLYEASFLFQMVRYDSKIILTQFQLQTVVHKYLLTMESEVFGQKEKFFQLFFEILALQLLVFFFFKLKYDQHNLLQSAFYFSYFSIQFL